MVLLDVGQILLQRKIRGRLFQTKPCTVQSHHLSGDRVWGWGFSQSAPNLKLYCFTTEYLLRRTMWCPHRLLSLWSSELPFTSSMWVALSLCLRRRPEPGLREPKFAEPKFGGRRKRTRTKVDQLRLSTQVENRRTRVGLRRKQVT